MAAVPRTLEPGLPLAVADWQRLLDALVLTLLLRG